MSRKQVGKEILGKIQILKASVKGPRGIEKLYDWPPSKIWSLIGTQGMQKLM